MPILNKNVIVFGDTCCGKSFLIWKFMNIEALEIPTFLTEEYNRDLVTNGQRFRFHIIDTGYPEMNERWITSIFDKKYSEADMALLCFDIGCIHTLESVCELWMPLIKEYSAKKVIPYILVGLKKDLRCNTTISGGEKYVYVPVTTEEGKRVAEKIKASAYVECSALREDGVQEVFETAANVFLKPSEKPDSKFNGFLKKIFGK